MTTRLEASVIPAKRVSRLIRRRTNLDSRVREKYNLEGEASVSS